MNRKETAAMLTLFLSYWPSFQISDGDCGEGELPGTVAVWAQFLEPYSAADCQTVLAKFRRQPERCFAPTASEFEGSILALLAEREAAQKRNAALEYRPSVRPYEATETYTLERGGQVRHYTRISKAAKLEKEAHYRAAGFVKEVIPLGNGQNGYRWVKA